MILLLDNYDSFTYNLYQCIEQLGHRCRVIRNDAIDVAGVRALKPNKIVLSPGPGEPRDAGILVELIRELHQEIPMLGVCLGHQAIGEAFGGKIVRAKRMMHGKVSTVRHDGRGVFRGLSREVEVARYHSLVVRRTGLPKELRVTAETADGVIMGVRHRKHAVEGVQFHPESIASPEGPHMIRNFLKS